jgi:hypothetical protein
LAIEARCLPTSGVSSSYLICRGGFGRGAGVEFCPVQVSIWYRHQVGLGVF